MTADKEQQLAAALLPLLGGADNLLSIAHCMTRLRLTVADETKVDKEKIKNLPGVLGLLGAEGRCQIVLGPGVVNKVTAHLQILQQKPATPQQPEPLTEARTRKAALDEKNRTPFKLLLRRLAGIFIPLIPAIVASGMVAGLTNLAIRLGLPPEHELATLLSVTGWGLFAYLSIFIGFNAAKEFGGTPALGGLAGVLLINPAIASIHLGGEALVPGRGGVIGVLLVACFMAWLERRLRRYVPNALDIIVTPTLTLLVGALATYYVLQPLGGFLSDTIIFAFKVLLQDGGGFAGFVLAGTILPIVMTGLHQGLTPIHMEFLNTLHENPLLPILAMGGAGQVGASLAVYLKTKNTRLRHIIKSALPVGLLGIGEPLIFGVTLPLGRPFFTACLGAACGGAYQAAMHTASISMGVSGLPLAFLIQPASLLHYLLGLVIAYVCGFCATWLAGFEDPVETSEEAGA